jgi:hypothetical protein
MRPFERSICRFASRAPTNERAEPHGKQPNHDVFDGVLKTTGVSRGEVSRLLKNHNPR